MNLAAGAHVGPYEIVALLGAGGMGEVYRARDQRLDREVAIKVLPAALAADDERVRRFEQEARAAGQLNHPNILAIHDIGAHERAPYIVSELLEGQTLRDRLRQGALAPRKAIDYALQVAQGLAAAHERGIVHRDLKPENLFLTKDGRIKILDFGLAKLKQADGAQEATASTVLPGASATVPGAVLGTCGYMAPEQVRGRPADHRADIFALGVVLYEMLTGQPAFTGDSAVEVMSNILTAEPPDLGSLGKHIPPALGRLVEHCLEKSPDERFQSARDLGFGLQALTGLSHASVAPGQLPVVRAAPRLRWVRLAVPLGMLLVAAGGFVLGQRMGRAPVPSFHQVTFRRGSVFDARFSPDGETIVYDAAWDGEPLALYVTRRESPESRPVGFSNAQLYGMSRAGEMAISLGARLIGQGNFVRAGTLARLPLAGGAPREILEDIQQADWAPDGSRLCVVRQIGGRTRLELPPGKVLYETAGWVSHPRVAPRGDAVAFFDHPVPADDGGEVALVELSGAKRTLSAGWITMQGLAWHPASGEIWFTADRTGGSRAVYAVTRSGRERLVVRAPATLTLHDIAADGRVLVARDNLRTGILALAPGEARERDLSWLDWSRVADLSADGRRLLFDEEGEGGGPAYSVYLRPTDGAPAVRLGDGGALALSSDGKWVLSLLMQPRPAQLHLLPAGAGEPRALTSDGINHVDAHFLPDGAHVLFQGDQPGHGTRLWVQALAGGPPRPITPEWVSYGGAISPDGQWVAGIDGERKVALYPVSGASAPRKLAGLEPGEVPLRFSGDGRALYLWRPGELPLRIQRLDLASGRKQLERTLMPADPAGLVAIGSLALTPDGRSYAYGYFRQLSDLYLIEGLK